MSEFLGSDHFRQVERHLQVIDSLIGEIEDADRAEQQLRDEFSGIDVDKFARGYAIEDDRVEKLIDEFGFSATPPNYPVWDAVKGQVVTEKGFTTVTNATAVSVKSTNVTDPMTLSRRIADYVQDIDSRKWDLDVYRKQHQYRIVSIKRKRLELFFEEGASRTRNFEAAVDCVEKQIAKYRNRIQFDWFYYEDGDAVPGSQYTKSGRVRP